MTKIYICDHCGFKSEKDSLLNFQVFRKLAGKKSGGKRVNCHDICFSCYKKIFKIDVKRIEKVIMTKKED